MERNLNYELLVNNVMADNSETEVGKLLKLRQLFFQITEEWESEEDICYDIPISTMSSILSKAPSFLEERATQASSGNMLYKRLCAGRSAGTQKLL